MMLVERALEALNAAVGRFAADAGVDHAVSVTFALQTLLQQRHPALPGDQPVAGRQGIADDQDDRWLRGPRRQGRDDDQT
jgi:hypothetical protein